MVIPPQRYRFTVDGRPVIAAPIMYFGAPFLLACDGQCHKAWGCNTRPRYIGGRLMTLADLRLYEDDNLWDYWLDLWGDSEDYAPDAELGEAPLEVDEWDAEDTKPTCAEEQLNKWCCRSCERACLFAPDESLALPDFSRRKGTSHE